MRSGPVRISDLDFQYPQSDRRRCNRGQAFRSIFPRSLSVSSVGSEALQHLIALCQRCHLHIPFSILSRIGGVATGKGIVKSLTYPHFQYPQSDRRRCNLAIWGSPGTVRTCFQYPQSDRRRCNPDGLLPPRPVVQAFSILSRIGGVATPGRRRPPPPPDPTFSILSRIGGVATKPGAPLSLQGGFLSVSSVGSEALQRLSRPAFRPASRAFSILSRIGGVATPCLRPMWDARPLFQYPQSDRRRCNEFFRTVRR